MSKMLLGCIADDFTGATDLANNLVRAGMRTIQTIGVPRRALSANVDAVVVALKSRTAAAAEAVAQSLDALRWLQAGGAEQIYFKYCSTFDSTPKGNIGPVTEALLDAVSSTDAPGFTIATPAFPDNGRTVFRGYLFVGDVLLHESGMQNHPLTPMTDSNLVRVLQAQCRRRVGLIDYEVVRKGADSIRHRMEHLRIEGFGIAIVDAISNDDLLKLGPALKSMPLVTAGSGVAIALPANFGLTPSNAASELAPPAGSRAIVSGSCSVATNRQVRAFVRAGGESFRVDPSQAANGVDVVAQAISWASGRLSHGPVLIYSTAEPIEVKAAQQNLGVQQAGRLVEDLLADIARRLVDIGVRQLVIAGGETAGACVQALNIEQMRIGPQIDPGVPWCYASTGTADVHLALKSGNFGTDDFFSKALAMLS
jgi:3-dehydrotetronate 4-kinase